MNDLSSLNTDVVKNVAKKLYLSNGKIRTTSKGRFNTRTKLAAITEKKEENKISGSKPRSPNKNDNENNEVKRPIHFNYSKTNINNNNIPRKENIILNQRLIQRFYAYSVLDFYSKYFKINLDAQSTDYDEENNIYLNKDIFDNNNVSDKDKNQIGKHTTRGKSVGSKTKGGKTSDINNNRLNNIKNVKNVRSGDMTVSGKSVMDKNGKKKQNIKSVSLLSNYCIPNSICPIAYYFIHSIILYY